MSGSVLLGELARIWRALTKGSHRWEIQGSFVCMLTEIINVAASSKDNGDSEAMSEDDCDEAKAVVKSNLPADTTQIMTPPVSQELLAKLIQGTPGFPGLVGLLRFGYVLELFGVENTNL